MKQPNLTDTDRQTRRALPRARSYLKDLQERFAGRDGLNAGGQLAAFALALLALFSRSPSLLTHAQFYAEDGTIWYAQAYNQGWLHSLALPDGGYLNTLQRLGAGLALLAPFRWAPLVTACLGMLIQALPVPILLSRRLDNWGSLPTRIVLAAVYVALTNLEINIVLTNSHWHLALAGVLLALASSPRSWRGRYFEGAFFLLAGFCGPFCILLAPLVLVFWWARRQPWSLAVFSLMSIGALTQMVVLLHTAPRTQAALGATPAAFLRMLGGNIVACALFGGYAFARVAPMVLLVPAALLGLSVYLYCLRFAGMEWKLFMLYCGSLLAASLRSPLADGSKPAWDLLVNDVSGRYWFFPMLAFLWGAAWCARYGRHRLFKIVGCCILLLMPFGVVRDWRYPNYTDSHFAESVQRMQDAKPGEHVVVPVVPDGWQMELVKKKN